MLAPFAPYVAQEIWEELGNEGPVFRQPWPAFDPELAKEDEAEIVVQVNGKLRSRIYAPFGTPKEELEAARPGRRKSEALPRRQAGGQSDHRPRQAGQYRGEVGQASRPVHVLQRTFVSYVHERHLPHWADLRIVDAVSSRGACTDRYRQNEPPRVNPSTSARGDEQFAAHRSRIGPSRPPALDSSSMNA